MQEPLHAAAVELDHTATDSGMASRADADQADQQAEQRVRRGPDDGEDAKGNGGNDSVGHVATRLRFFAVNQEFVDLGTLWQIPRLFVNLAEKALVN